MPAEKTGLCVDEDLCQQEKLWKIERISWGVLLLIVIAALAGLLGHGYLSKRTAGSAEAGFTIEYQRFERHQLQSQFTLQLTPEAVQQGTTRLLVGRDFMREMEITSIEPQPVRNELAGRFLLYEFDTSAAGAVVFHFLPVGFGSVQLEVGLEARPLQSFPMLVYP
ncbi:MAG: hypothetical protein V4603_10945 [Pseudomonadota bacterium]